MYERGNNEKIFALQNVSEWMIKTFMLLLGSLFLLVATFNWNIGTEPFFIKKIQWEVTPVTLSTLCAKRKMTSTEDDLNRRRPLWKMTSTEEVINE